MSDGARTPAPAWLAKIKQSATKGDRPEKQPASRCWRRFARAMISNLQGQVRLIYHGGQSFHKMPSLSEAARLDCRSFKNRDVVAVTAMTERPINGLYQAALSARLVEELLNALVDDHEAYVRWVRDFQTFDVSFGSTRKASSGHPFCPLYGVLLSSNFQSRRRAKHHYQGEVHHGLRFRRIVKEEIIRCGTKNWPSRTSAVYVEAACLPSNIEGVRSLAKTTLS